MRLETSPPHLSVTSAIISTFSEYCQTPETSRNEERQSVRTKETCNRLRFWNEWLVGGGLVFLGVRVDVCVDDECNPVGSTMRPV